MKVDKPWGYEIRWAINDKYLGKILHINAGHRLSKQYHKHKDETIYVLDGSLLFEIGPHHEVQQVENPLREVLQKGSNRRIMPGIIHRYCADIGDVTLIEVSTPEIDDVVRLEDDYNRDTGSN